MGSNNMYYPSIDRVYSILGESYIIVDDKKTGLPVKITVKEFFENATSLGLISESDSNQEVFGFINKTEFPVTGELESIYIDQDLSKVWIWNGSDYVTVSITDHESLSGIGVNSHAQIDSHISNTDNPHSVEISDVSPLTTKGDIHGFGTSDLRVPVGPNGSYLLSDSTEDSGLRWGVISSSDTILITQGGQWAYNGNTWRIASSAANIYSNNSSTIAISSVTYPFNPGLDWASYINSSTPGFSIPKPGFVKCLSASIYNTLADQDICVTAIVLRLNSFKQYQFVDQISATVPVSLNKLENAVVSKTIAVEAGDVVYFSTASQINQTTTKRNYIAFSLEVELNL